METLQPESHSPNNLCKVTSGRARTEPGGTRWRTGGEVKGKLANGVGSQCSHVTSERGITSITKADAHTSAASCRLNWRPLRFEWTHPFRGKTKSGFCACAITFRTSYNADGEKTFEHLGPTVVGMQRRILTLTSLFFKYLTHSLPAI